MCQGYDAIRLNHVLAHQPETIIVFLGLFWGSKQFAAMYMDIYVY